jgi:hypothetical protein
MNAIDRDRAVQHAASLLAIYFSLASRRELELAAELAVDLLASLYQEHPAQERPQVREPRA